ncbi:MAG TPA: hypothetical protein PLO61_07775 [Fimbriimonadaceae bacterium]|nr:hypothetical protein [Fimbriimonadaceae bacterium]HRJ34092.1 hypothetical protein [Fimbriimonadaceae bacterium]
MESLGPKAKMEFFVDPEYRFKLKRINFGWRLELWSPWSDSFKAVINQYDIIEIGLSVLSGFSSKTLEFLSEFPSLESVEILGGEYDPGPILKIPSLKRINLVFKPTAAMDFERLPGLEEAIVSWRPQLASLLELTQLRSFRCSGLPSKHFGRIAEMKNLRALYLSGSNTIRLKSLAGHERLEDLEFNKMIGIDDWDVLSSIHRLRKLHIHYSKSIRSIEFIQLLHKNFQDLCLFGCPHVRTLEPLRPIASLRRLTVRGPKLETQFDLTILLDKPNLEWVNLSGMRTVYRGMTSGALDISDRGTFGRLAVPVFNG